MTPETEQVLAGSRRWAVDQADCIQWLQSLPTDSVDLIVTSSPYVDARLYLEDGQDLGIARGPEEWVAWMVEVVREASRVCKGLIALVVEGRTEDRRYDCTPLLLAADLHRAGFHLRKPCCYFRFGIPGSGSKDWWRNDWEPVLCVARPGPLPWSDNTATGHPPKWGPGGEMSNRKVDGSRVNQWGGRVTAGGQRRKDGSRQAKGRPSHKTGPGTVALANPGNVVQEQYPAEKVRSLLEEYRVGEIPYSDVIRCLVGGNQMGSPLAHENEAPFPESLVYPFVVSFCPPGGVVADPFSGSGTTGAVAVRTGRRFVGCDLRQSQVDLARYRIGGETRPLFPEGAEVAR